MIRKSAAVALLSSFAVSMALAQTPGGRDMEVSVTTGATPPVPAQRQNEGAAGSDAKLPAGADARACLDFVTNIGVIRCAEKYRYRQARPTRQGSASDAGSPIESRG